MTSRCIYRGLCGALFECDGDLSDRHDSEGSTRFLPHYFGQSAAVSLREASVSGHRSRRVRSSTSTSSTDLSVNRDLVEEREFDRIRSFKHGPMPSYSVISARHHGGATNCSISSSSLNSTSAIISPARGPWITSTHSGGKLNRSFVSHRPGRLDSLWYSASSRYMVVIVPRRPPTGTTSGNFCVSLRRTSSWPSTIPTLCRNRIRVPSRYRSVIARRIKGSARGTSRTRNRRSRSICAYLEAGTATALPESSCRSTHPGPQCGRPVAHYETPDPGRVVRRSQHASLPC